ncbi:MAG: DUF547 domain-containing protein [Phormidesmis sp.]
MLRNYVQDGAVDYSRWQAESAQALDNWLAEISTAEIDTMDQESAIAFLLNLYNALVVRQVLQKYPISSIRPTVLGIPNWISFLLFFKKPVYRLNGQSLSLDGLEHGILRDRYQEPRIHFALVCAAEGCPLLRANAYLPEHLPNQLQEDAQRFINNPDKVNYDEANNILHCSKILKWYKQDFLTQSASVPDYLQRYLLDASIPPNVNINYLPYSWQLNQRTSS